MSLRSISFRLFGTLACTLIFGVSSFAQPKDAVTLTILHYNDFHAQNVPTRITKKDSLGNRYTTEVGGYAFLKRMVDSLREKDPQALLLHAGDDFQGSPVSSITKGASQFALMNIMKPDAFTPGNHEFDYGRTILESYMTAATFPIVSANLFDKEKGALLLPPVVLDTVHGLVVAIVGLSTPDLERLTVKENVKGLMVLDPVETMTTLLTSLRKKVTPNLVVVLSHMGIELDSALAARVPGIDVIVGGHSHTTLFKPMTVGSTVIVQAGARGRWLGKLDITYDRAQRRVTRTWGKLLEVPASGVQPDPAMQARVDEFEGLVDAGMKEVIGELKTDWVRAHGPAESNLGNWMADVIRDYAKADVGLQNSGGIRKDLVAGPITVRDIWEISPFGNEFVTIRVTGVQLLSMLAYQGLKEREFCQVSGVVYRYDRTLPPDRALTAYLADGTMIEPEKEYTVAMNNYTAGHLNEVFGLPQSSIEVTPVYPPQPDREVFIEYVRKQKVISSALEGRITIIGR